MKVEKKKKKNDWSTFFLSN